MNTMKATQSNQTQNPHIFPPKMSNNNYAYGMISGAFNETPSSLYNQYSDV